MAQTSTPLASPIYGTPTSNITPKTPTPVGGPAYSPPFDLPRPVWKPGFLLHPMLSASNRYASTIAYPPSPIEVLWLASRCIRGSPVAVIPPFRDETADSWRAVAIECVPRHTKVTEFLQAVKPHGLESVRQTVDGYGTQRIELRFLRHALALLFYTQYLLNPPNADEPGLSSISWIPAPPITKEVREAITSQRATRFLLLERESAEDEAEDSVRLELLEALASFGVIQNIVQQPWSESKQTVLAKTGASNRKCTWEITFTCVESAIKAFSELRLEHVTSVSFGRDTALSRLQKHAASLYLTKSPYDPTSLRGLRPFELVDALAHQSLAAIIVCQLCGGEFNVGNRCVCISHLPPGTQLVEICNTVRGGMIESVKLVPDRNICFVTFLEATAAVQFWATYQMRSLNVNCERVRVGWGRNPGPVAPEIAAIASSGATRNLCIQIDAHTVDWYRQNVPEDKKNALPLALNEVELRRIFSPFGTIEQIRVAQDVCCSFVTFTSIVNAVQAVEWARTSSQFAGTQIQYGKDRCAALPKCVARSHNTEAILVQFLRRKLPALLTQSQAQAAVVSPPLPYPMLPPSPYAMASPSPIPMAPIYYETEQPAVQSVPETYPEGDVTENVFGGPLDS